MSIPAIAGGRDAERRALLRRAGATVTGATAAWLIACTGSRKSQPATRAPFEAADTSGERPPRDQLTIGIGADVTSLDPHGPAAAIPTAWPVSWLYDGLAGVDRVSRTVVPGLALGWRVLDGGQTWEARLKPGITFHNGESVDAESVVASFERAAGSSPGTANGSAPRIQAVSAVDALTVRVTTSVPNPLVGEVFAPRVVPRSLAREQPSELAVRPVGTGPFRFVEHRPGVSLTLAANDTYYRRQRSPEQRGMPLVRTLVQRILPDGQARVSALLAGGVDLIHPTPPDALKQLERDRAIQVALIQTARPLALLINALDAPDAVGPNPFRDRRVRQAVAQALDVDALIRDVLTGRERRAGLLSTGSFGWQQPSPARPDIATARALLAAAGHTDGIETRITLAPEVTYRAREACDAMVRALAPVGIRANLHQAGTTGEHLAALSSRQATGLHLVMLPSSETAFAPLFRYFALPSGALALHPPAADVEAPASAALVEFEPARRRALVEQAVQALAGESWLVPLWEEEAFFAFRTGALEYQPTPFAVTPEYDLFKPRF